MQAGALKPRAFSADIRVMRTRLALAGILALVCTTTALAAPRRVIILRHGETANGFAPSPTGLLRAEALTRQFLGKDATLSLFQPREQPAGILSITLHTVELISPVAASWGLPQVSFSVVPATEAGVLDNVALNRRTQAAHRHLMHSLEYRGRTVVVCWEHDRIASAEIEAAYPGERVTWRQLLELDGLPDGQGALVPTTWPDDIYDYFWIVDFDEKGRAARFESKRQTFVAPYDDLPQNLWGEPE